MGSSGILGLGSAAMDHVLRCDDLPRQDGFALVLDEQILPGGSCANVLAAAANLGTPASLVAKMGDDTYGRAFKADLERSAVSGEFLILEKGGASLHTFITVARDGSKAIFVHMGSSLSLSAEEVHEGMLDGKGVYFTDMIPAPPALKLARLASSRDLTVVFHVEVAPSFMDLCGISRREIHEMLALSNLVIGSMGALTELAGREDPVEAAWTLKTLYEPSLGVVSTMGENGAVWVTSERDDTLLVPAYQVRTVDTTGAGDAFAAGLLHAFFSARLDRRVSMEFASACAAIKCTQWGPRLKAKEPDVWSFLQTASSRGN